jgi:hypothetical protein
MEVILSVTFLKKKFSFAPGIFQAGFLRSARRSFMAAANS